jgi:hypothetical protein
MSTPKSILIKTQIFKVHLGTWILYRFIIRVFRKLNQQKKIHKITTPATSHS